MKQADAENIVSLYTQAIGDEQLSEAAWKRIADANAAVLAMPRETFLDSPIGKKVKTEFADFFNNEFGNKINDPNFKRPSGDEIVALVLQKDPQRLRRLAKLLVEAFDTKSL